MGSFRLSRYSDKNKLEWDSFLDNTRNGIFLFKRNFMDYHSDRFFDHSLLIWEEEKLIALFPANQNGTSIISHQGLTFGGLLYKPEINGVQIKDAINEIIRYFTNEGCSEIIFKPVPFFLHVKPAQEDIFFWSLKGSTLIRRDLTSVVDLKLDFKFSKGRKWSINKAIKNGVMIKETDDFESFYNILSLALETHHTRPVHTISELQLLKSRFDKEIKLFGAYINGELVAGALCFYFAKTLHTQYLANSSSGREVGALDFLISHLLSDARKNSFNYLSFGISTTNEGKNLNEGLLHQKESFGSGGVVLDWYKLLLN